MAPLVLMVILVAVSIMGLCWRGFAYADTAQASPSRTLSVTSVDMSATARSLGTTASQAHVAGAYKYKVNGDGTVTITKFIGSKNVANVSIPSHLNGRKVSVIGKKAFSGLDKLRRVKIPRGVKRVKSSAFSGCYRLSAVSLPSTLKRVDGSAFYGAPIKNLKLPSHLNKIGWFAFGYTRCVTLPRTMKSFEWRDYVSGDGTCTLAKIKVAKGSKYFSFKNGVLYNKKKTHLVYYLPSNSRNTFKVPNSVRVIEQFAFDYCFGLNKVRLGNKVTTFAKGAFLGTNVGETFTLPSTMRRLGAYSISYSTKQLVVKSKKLTARNVKDCLKDSSVSTVVVRVSANASVNRAYAEKYRKVFTYDNVGKYVYVTY